MKQLIYGPCDRVLLAEKITTPIQFSATPSA